MNSSGKPNLYTIGAYNGNKANASVPNSIALNVLSAIAIPMALAASPFLAILCPSIIDAAVVLLPGIPVNNDVYESAVELEAMTLIKNTSPA